MSVIFGNIRRRIGPLLWRRRWSTLSRSDYGRVWDKQSVTEADAKIAVSGSTDEAEYQRTAEFTVEVLRACVGIRPLDTVLEIGAGVGRVGAALAPLCGEWIGADASSSMIEHMKRRLAHLPNVRTLLLNGYDLASVPSGSVDLIYCTVVFMHLDEWDRYGYVREGMRVLKPGGRMLVDNVNLLTDEGWNLFEQHCTIPPRERPAHISRFSTPAELEAYFRRAGFSDIGQLQSGLWIFTYGVKPDGGA
jgi:SAM-dependent methyltransferase